MQQHKHVGCRQPKAKLGRRHVRSGKPSASNRRLSGVWDDRARDKRLTWPQPRAQSVLIGAASGVRFESTTTTRR